MTGSNEPKRRGRLGDFEIVREIGRGGMGIVYEARQVVLECPVVLKISGGKRLRSALAGQSELQTVRRCVPHPWGQACRHDQ